MLASLLNNSCLETCPGSDIWSCSPEDQHSSCECQGHGFSGTPGKRALMEEVTLNLVSFCFSWENEVTEGRLSQGD